MRLFRITTVVASFGICLTACSALDQQSPVQPDVNYHEVAARTNDTPTPPGQPLDDSTTATASHPTTMTESVGLKSMDSLDKTKLSHALDKPLGKSTQWTNEVTDVSYTVVPISKVTINDNPYCRRYNVTVSRGDKSSNIAGTACVDSNGGWQSVSG